MNNETTLVRMANQIATFFRSQPEEQAIAGTADHIHSYWNKVMRRDIYAYMDQGGTGLDPLALKALEQLRASEKSHNAS
ncbi:formate dehydrogenase subunit delta [Methylocella sp. CPCC 101449]|uniref:formate dehydrogenase subunit delta n=1 Tax=Methylocella sp. CPCC 101449 TaxID=2987531 RepID=UPI0028916A13|nr:formate dehydrogenase subunit delta [Methylocella sp. CPCC 101449]MDT2023653.1 formate dehydrogenase subunit delta [Methylocella sp. CPCC 101449]HEV2573810.1 formate dehydrogenase subunit delta [Beijerinckiaceae bacterium]